MMASVESMKEGEASGEETQEPPSKSSTDNEKTEKELPPLSGTFPEESRNCFSRISFHFLAPLMVLGYKRPLRHDDLWDLPESERVAKLLENYSSTKAQLCAKAVAAKSAASNAADTGSPEQETADGTSENVSAADVEVQTGENEESVEPTIGQVLWKQFRPAILLSGFFMLLQVACQVGGPLLIQQIVLATESTDTSDPYRGLYLAFIYFAVQFLNAIFQQQHLHRITRVGTCRCSLMARRVALRRSAWSIIGFTSLLTGQRIRAVLMALIYRQSLELRQIDLASSKQANAVNLMSNDAQKFFDIMLTLHMVWAAPLQIVVAAIFLIILLGWWARNSARLMCILPVQLLTAPFVLKAGNCWNRHHRSSGANQHRHCTLWSRHSTEAHGYDSLPTASVETRFVLAERRCMTHLCHRNYRQARTPEFGDARYVRIC